jgi:hypothetical protein
MTNPTIFAMAMLAALALSGCDKAVTAGNANAPGSPGTGNPTVVTAPAAADTPATGAPGGDTVPGTTGRGTAEMGSRSASPLPGTGTAGGLGGSSGLGMTGSFPTPGASASVGGNGSANLTTKSSTGN